MMTANGKGFSRLLCYYGDDFTGSTDVLEALSGMGVKAALFLDPPDEELLNGKFRGLEAFGIAGVGRSLAPDEAERELRPLFEALKQADAAVVHYKVCSTFDSSPGTGNIGKAAEIGRSVFGSAYVPVLAGVPYLGRYTLFGSHFAAAADGAVHRLDRHPTMSRHPVTPMKEADLRRVLAEQTGLRTSLMDILALDGSAEEVSSRLQRLLAQEEPELVLFDVLDEERLGAAGRLIWEEAMRRRVTLFAVGSSGIEYALGACWREEGRLQRGAASGLSLSSGASAIAPADRLLAVSGSCSPVTREQIRTALAAGFAGIRVPAAELLSPESAASAREAVLAEAAGLLNAGRSVLLYSAEGPDDPGIAEFRAALAAGGYRAGDSSRLLGGMLGSLARALVLETGVTRLLVAGGDTSGYVTRGLGIYGMECTAALAPGAPLCRAFSHEPKLEGLELVLKGGQVGGADFFLRVKEGGLAAERRMTT